MKQKKANTLNFWIEVIAKKRRKVPDLMCLYLQNFITKSPNFGMEKTIVVIIIAENLKYSWFMSTCRNVHSFPTVRQQNGRH
jgi:hypothetical protein